MNRNVKKMLALCGAYEEIFGCDECRQKEIVTEDEDCYDEWQDNLEDEEIEDLKNKMIDFFNSL